MQTALNFSPRQRATIAAALTLAAVVLLVAVVSLMLWGLSLFVSAFRSVLMPPVAAGVLAMLLRPYYTWLQRLCRGSRTLALVLFFVSAFAPILGLFWLFAQFAIEQTLAMLRDLPEFTAQLNETARRLWPEAAQVLEKYGLSGTLGGWFENPGESIQNALRMAGERVGQSVVGVFQSAAGLLAWAVLPVYLAFFLMAPPFRTSRLGEYLPFLKPGTRDDVIYLLEQFVAILLTFFRAQIVIALLQGILYAVGFALVGLPYGFFIGFALGLLNIIPYLGSIAGLGVALPLAYLSEGGGLLQAGLVLGVFTGVQCIEGYYLTPKIMGDRTGLHPAMIIFAVFFWGTAMSGILGMMLAIPLTAFMVVFWRLLKIKYIREIV